MTPNMNTGCLQPKPALVVFLFHFIFYSSCHLAELQICSSCNGTVLNDTVVGQFCSASSGRVEGRCCLQNLNSSTTEHITGLDLSGCSLNQIDVFRDADTAVVIDLTNNPIASIADFAFQGFSALNEILLPSNLSCPGGNASWDTVALSRGGLVCQGQRSMCTDSRHMTPSCPENSCCAPNGPGFFMCGCIHGFHGYKCRREGEFPFIPVFAPLGVATVTLAVLLWFTQRRKAKSN